MKQSKDYFTINFDLKKKLSCLHMNSLSRGNKSLKGKFDSGIFPQIAFLINYWSQLCFS